MPPSAPKSAPLAVPGFTLSGVACGIKSNGNKDLIIITSDTPATVAGVFTQNVVIAAPVTVSRAVVAHGTCQALIANSGNANACTGAQGMTDTQAMAAQCADALGIDSASVAVASTGVIGQTLPMQRVSEGIGQAVSCLTADGWEDAAHAICTTDLVPKWHSATATIAGQTVTVTGIAKGSGMIHPNMATMLGFICTDAKIDQAPLQSALAQAVEQTFNRITVDGDTSTNDTVLALANGHADTPKIVTGSTEYATLYNLLEEVCGVLARAIVADGEGATKLVTVHVEGANSEADALAIARQIGTSSLVKTALFAADPNWGRILAAAGQAGIVFDPDHASLHFDDHCLYAAGHWQGQAAEDSVSQVMAKDAYAITLTLGNGPGNATIWTCDLSYDYVKINAEYRT